MSSKRFLVELARRGSQYNKSNNAQISRRGVREAGRCAYACSSSSAGCYARDMAYEVTLVCPNVKGLTDRLRSCRRVTRPPLFFERLFPP